MNPTFCSIGSKNRAVKAHILRITGNLHAFRKFWIKPQFATFQQNCALKITAWCEILHNRANSAEIIPSIHWIPGASSRVNLDSGSFPEISYPAWRLLQLLQSLRVLIICSDWELIVLSCFFLNKAVQDLDAANFLRN